MLNEIKKIPPRAFWFFAIVFALVLGAAGIGTILALGSAERTFRLDQEQRLDSQLRDGVAASMLWHQNLVGHIERMSKADLVRLFAAESGDKRKSPDAGANTAELNATVPILRKMFMDFMNYTGFVSTKLVNAQLEVLLSNTPEDLFINAYQKEVLQKVIASGEPVVSTAHPSEGGLLVEMAYPVFAPDYLSAPGSNPVAALVFTYELGPRLLELRKAGVNGEVQHLLQQEGEQLEELTAEGSLRPLEHWKLENGELPIGLRTLPDGSEVFAKGLPIPGLPWVLALTQDSDLAQEDLLKQRSFILYTSVQATVICLLLLGVFWWRLVWRRERSVSGALVSLNDTVNRQNQLLASIDNTLPGGVALSDTKHILLHVNKSFAAVLQHSPKALLGISLPTLFRDEMAETLRKTLPEVLEKGESRSFTGTLDEGEKTIHCQVVCTPFRNADDEIAGVVSVFQDITEEVEKQALHQRQIDKIISVLVRAIEAVDPYLCGQSAHTKALAEKLLPRLGLEGNDAAVVLTAAQLYQIGLIQVPKDILNKEQKLTAEERTVLERHVAHAQEALASMDFDPDVLDTIGQIYERLDGSGYPKKLSGDQIRVHARLLAVANTFCAVVRPRAYRNAKNTDEALRILSATPPQYDPDIVKALKAFLATPEGAAFLEALRR